MPVSKTFCEEVSCLPRPPLTHVLQASIECVCVCESTVTNGHCLNGACLGVDEASKDRHLGL